MLADAHSHAPRDGQVCDRLGTFFFAHGRFDDGAQLWHHTSTAGSTAPYSNAAWAFTHGVSKETCPALRRFMRRPSGLREYRLYPDLDEIYSELGDQSRRARLLTPAPLAVLDRDVVRVQHLFG